MSHRLARRGSLVSAALLSLAVIAPVAPASASIVTAAILVNTKSPAADDGLCAFAEAIQAVHDLAAVDACGPGAAGGTTITFDPSLTHGIIDGNADLATISTPLTIEGGQTDVFLQGNGFRLIQTSAALTIAHVTLTGGASSSAGLIDATASVTISHVLLENGVGGVAGAIVASGPLTITDSTIGYNTGGTGGGAIEATGTVSITRTIFDTNSGGAGGAINNHGPSLSVLQSAFRSNAASGKGGALNLVDTSAVIAESEFDNNSGSGGGGAIRVAGSSTVTVSNSTLAHNWTSDASSRGGAILHEGGSLSLLNDTIAWNTADMSGGGVYAAPNLYLGNTVLAANALTNPAAGGFQPKGAARSQAAGPNVVADGYNLTGTPATDTANILSVSTAGLLDANGFGYHGGPVRTIALPAGSPAINTADAAVCGSPPVDDVDGRGFARDPAACDVGAYERDLTAPVVTALTWSPRPTWLLSGAALPVLLSWTATDAGTAGLHHYKVEQRIDSGPWTVIADSETGTIYGVTVAPGHSTAFRVTAYDGDNNASAAKATAVPVKPTLVQQTSSAVHYTGKWAKSTSALYSGGSAAASSTKGSSASITFTGRGVAIIATVAPARGVMTIYVNGVKTATVDTKSSSRADRTVVWRKLWSTSRKLTIKVVVAGTSGRPRVDLDAIVELK